ncbi:MAG: efflux RND transporter periplasmic adaptor subunit, partial [Bacteroidota bacterium]
MNNNLQLITLIAGAILLGSCGGQQEKKVPVAAPQAMEQSDVLMLSGRELQLAGVITGLPTAGSHTNQRRAVGRLVNASPAETTLTPRYSGRIVRLYARNIGQIINTGEAIAELYSPELSALMAEHLLLLNRAAQHSGIGTDYRQLVTASQQKMKRAGMTATQISALEKSNKVPDWITWHAETSGTIQEILVQEGSWVPAGTSVVTLRSNRSLLVEVGVYPDEQQSVGSRLAIVFPGGMNTHGTIEAILPETGADALTTTLRLRAAKLPADAREGDPATVIIETRDAKQLWVPDAAVARSGEHAGIFILSGPGTFRLQRVVTGESAGGKTAITGGLNPGDS